MEQAYFSSEVAKTLGIGASSLRKYSLAMESQGYTFHRGINNSRVFYQKDILTVQRIISLMNKKNVTLEQAINLAISSVSDDDIAMPATDSKQPAAMQEQVILERLDRLEKINMELLHRMEQQRQDFVDVITRQQEYIDGRLVERDARIMESFRQLQETKQVMLEMAAAHKKSWWKRLFK